jgi:HAD superfamily hydrolase (TIGR01509 family)
VRGVIRAVLFDLDGTLVDSERQNAESVARVLQARGRPLDDVEREFVIGHGWAEIHHFLVGRGGVDLPFKELMHLAAVEREKIAAAEGLDVLPGAVACVQRMAAKFRIAVVSGSSREEIEMVLRSLDVIDRFAFFLGAEDTARGKPHPDGYQLAAKRLGVQANECLVLEDSQAGIRAARNAGMAVIAVRAGNFAHQPQDEAHCVVETLDAVDEALLEKVAASAYAGK